MSNPLTVPDEQIVEVPLSEIKAIRQLADSLSTQNNLVLQGQADNNDLMKALLTELGKQETLVIPAPEVVVKAAQVTIPDIPAPVVQVMEAPEPEERLKVYNIIRDGRGVMIRIEESWK
jgi:hypothetical protein